MKKILVIVVISAGIVLNSCEKKPFDFRNKYLGKYEFISYYRNWNVQTLQLEETTNIFQGSVELTSGNNRIIINYIENDELEVELTKNGYFSGRLTGGYGGWYGEFDNNGNVAFNYTPSGMGASFTYDVIGKKIN